MNESILLELKKIRECALKLEDEIWEDGDGKKGANKLICEIIFQATEAIKKFEDSSGKEKGQKAVKDFAFELALRLFNDPFNKTDVTDLSATKKRIEKIIKTIKFTVVRDNTPMSLSQSVPPYKERVKYFLEEMADHKWYSRENLYDNKLPSPPDIWTNDPHLALSWDGKNDAEKFRNAGFNFPNYKITEHLFPPYKEEEKFYCKEYDKNSYTCEEQCKACYKADNMPEIPNLELEDIIDNVFEKISKTNLFENDLIYNIGNKSDAYFIAKRIFKEGYKAASPHQYKEEEHKCKFCGSYIHKSKTFCDDECKHAWEERNIEAFNKWQKLNEFISKEEVDGEKIDKEIAELKDRIAKLVNKSKLGFGLDG